MGTPPTGPGLHASSGRRLAAPLGPGGTAAHLGPLLRAEGEARLPELWHQLSYQSAPFPGLLRPISSEQLASLRKGPVPPWAADQRPCRFQQGWSRGDGSGQCPRCSGLFTSAEVAGGSRCRGTRVSSGRRAQACGSAPEGRHLRLCQKPAPRLPAAVGPPCPPAAQPRSPPPAF